VRIVLKIRKIITFTSAKKPFPAVLDSLF